MWTQEARCHSFLIQTNSVISIVFSVLRKAFEAFDSQKSGSIPCDMVADILRLMGQPFDKKILEELIEEVDADSKYSKYQPKLFSNNGNIQLIAQSCIQFRHDPPVYFGRDSDIFQLCFSVYMLQARHLQCK